MFDATPGYDKLILKLSYHAPLVIISILSTSWVRTSKDMVKILIINFLKYVWFLHKSKYVIYII